MPYLPISFLKFLLIAFLPANLKIEKYWKRVNGLKLYLFVICKILFNFVRFFTKFISTVEMPLLWKLLDCAIFHCDFIRSRPIPCYCPSSKQKFNYFLCIRNFLREELYFLFFKFMRRSLSLT